MSEWGLPKPGGSYARTMLPERVRVRTDVPIAGPYRGTGHTSPEQVILRDSKDLAAWLRRVRTKRGMGQTEFAHRHGFSSQGQVSEWERGKFEPKLSTAIRIAAALDCDLVLVPRGERR